MYHDIRKQCQGTKYIVADKAQAGISDRHLFPATVTSPAPLAPIPGCPTKEGKVCSEPQLPRTPSASGIAGT